MAKNESLVEDNKKKIKLFFSLTEELQTKMANKPANDKNEDIDLEDVNEVISVELDKEEAKTETGYKPAYCDLTNLIGDDTDEEEDGSLYDILKNLVASPSIQKIVTTPTTTDVESKP